MHQPVTALGKGLRVEWVDFYGDLTMHAYLADGAGQRTEVCVDGRANSPTRYRLFQQARHPSQPGAALVELAPRKRASWFHCYCITSIQAGRKPWA